MQEVRSYRHSGLYYRNTVIVWTVTILVFWTALTAPRHWVSMLVVLVGLYLSYFLWATYRSVHPGKSIFRRRIPHLEVDLKAERVDYLSRDGLQLSGWLLPGEEEGR